MNLDDLYGHMKEALRFFDLSFHEMAKVSVTSGGSFLVFRYEGRAVMYAIPTE